MSSDNGQGVWGFIILIACLLVFGMAFIKFVLWIIGIALGFLLIGFILDKLNLYSLGMPKDEDE